MPRLHQVCFLSLCLLLTTSTLPAQSPAPVSVWLTTPDRAALVALQPKTLSFDPATGGSGQATISVDDKQRFQAIDGFGFALTGGSAQLLMKMSPPARHAILEEIFGQADRGAQADRTIGVSYLRLSIGASDMNERVFTYDDMPEGQTDPKLDHFQLGPDLMDVVPVMREILAIDPGIKILGTPWTAPSWMKSNGKPKGGSLKPEMYDVYANYLARYVESMARQGIRIDTITPQNEPLNPKNTPSLVMTAEEEAAFIQQSLGPTFRKQSIATKIILYDHNCDRPDYPLTILADKDAAQYVDGSGFHLYGGTIDAMSKVHDAYPDKNLYFTEQMVVDRRNDGPDLQIAQPVAEIVIGATSNWSRNVLLWNLAADPNFGPHTNDGGCPMCEGAITLDGDTVTRNRAFYTIAHASKFVRPGSVRIASTCSGDAVAQVAFRRPDGRTVLLVANRSHTSQSFTILAHGLAASASLPAGAVATYVW